MPKRKSPGEGTIRQLPSGRYRGELMLGYKPDGTRNVFRCVADTKEEVRAAFRKAHDRNEKGQQVTSSRHTTATFLQEWLTTVAQPRVSPLTYDGYKDIIERLVLPTIGHIKLGQLSPTHLQRLYNERLKTLSGRSVLHIHRCLHTAFKTAVRWELLYYNPCDRLDPPKATKQEQRALSPDEAITFYRTALIDDDYGPFFIVALTTGLRSGEMYALKWEDVDWSSRKLGVRRAFSRVTGQGRYLKSTKTERGRSVPLLDVTVDALQRQRQHQIKVRLMAGPNWTNNDYIFTNEYGQPIGETAIFRAFRRLLVKAELPQMRPYDLRHSAASLYLALGVSGKDVQALLGHSTIQLTYDTYGHSFPTTQAQMMRRLNDLLVAESL